MPTGTPVAHSASPESGPPSLQLGQVVTWDRYLSGAFVLSEPRFVPVIVRNVYSSVALVEPVDVKLVFRGRIPYAVPVPLDPPMEGFARLVSGNIYYARLRDLLTPENDPRVKWAGVERYPAHRAASAPASPVKPSSLFAN